MNIRCSGTLQCSIQLPQTARVLFLQFQNIKHDPVKDPLYSTSVLSSMATKLVYGVTIPNSLLSSMICCFLSCLINWKKKPSSSVKSNSRSWFIWQELWSNFKFYFYKPNYFDVSLTCKMILTERIGDPE